MFHTEELKRLSPIGVFFAVYSLVFLLWKATFLYSLPFLLGLLIAAALQPVIRWAQDRLHLGRTAASGIITLAALTLLLSGLILMTVLGVRELAEFLTRAASGGFPEFSPPVQRFFRWLGSFVNEIDAEFLERHREQIMDFLKNSADLAMAALNGVLGLLASLPALLAMALVTGFSAFFIARDFDALRGWARGLIRDKTAGQLKSAAARSSGAGRKYLLSYMLIYFISFCEAFIILSVLNVPYPLMSAVITCFADILPVLGPGFVLGPIAVWQALRGLRPGGRGTGWVGSDGLRAAGGRAEAGCLHRKAASIDHAGSSILFACGRKPLGTGLHRRILYAVLPVAQRRDLTRIYFAIVFTMTAFWACRRFSASSKMYWAFCSNTSSVISSPLWAGRQCWTMASGLALAMIFLSTQ